MKTIKSTLAICALALSASANAAVITYSGADNLAGPGAPRPNADAALTNFLSAVGSSSSINFENLAPSLNPTNLTVAPGVTLTVTGNISTGLGEGITVDTPHVGYGYNTTAGGNTFLRLAPNFNSPTGATATFSFAAGIDAFGLFLTGSEDTFPGAITLGFDDGTFQSIGVTENVNGGGVVFYGFTDFGKSINSVSLQGGATSDIRDLFGIDDVVFSLAGVPDNDVPEPASLALAGLGLATMGAVRRRRAARKA